MAPTQSRFETAEAEDKRMRVMAIDLVLEKILKHMGRKTLMESRRVCQQWNHYAKQFMGHLIKLNHMNIVEYFGLVQSQQIGTSMKLRVRIDPQVSQAHISTWESVVQTLKAIVGEIGPHCVSALQCPLQEGMDWTEISDLIKLIAPGLETLVMDDDAGDMALPGIAWPGTQLPELRNLHLRVEMLKYPRLFAILNSSPKLKSLSLLVDPLKNPDDPVYDDLNGAITRFYNKIEQAATANNLVELEAVLDDLESYQALMRLNFPKLRRLKLQLNKNSCPTSQEVVKKFLLENCPKLESLEFSFLQDSDAESEFPDGSGISEFPCLPELPRLKHFGYGVEQDTKDVSPAFIRLPPSPTGIYFPFPNLQSMTVRFGSFLYLGETFDGMDVDENPGEWRQYHYVPAMPAVAKLNLLVTGAGFEPRPPGSPNLKWEDVCTQFGSLFPNITHMVFNNKTLPTHGNINVAGHIIAEMVKVMGPGLENLEVYGYFQDWLLSPARANLQNLTSLIIWPLGKAIYEVVRTGGASISYEGLRQDSSDIVRVQDFYPHFHADFIRGMLPNLQDIQLEGGMLVDPRDPRTADEMVQFLHQKYPGFRINLLE